MPDPKLSPLLEKIKEQEAKRPKRKPKERFPEETKPPSKFPLEKLLQKLLQTEKWQRFLDRVRLEIKDKKGRKAIDEAQKRIEEERQELENIKQEGYLPPEITDKQVSTLAKAISGAWNEATGRNSTGEYWKEAVRKALEEGLEIYAYKGSEALKTFAREGVNTSDEFYKRLARPQETLKGDFPADFFREKNGSQFYGQNEHRSISNSQLTNLNLSFLTTLALIEYGGDAFQPERNTDAGFDPFNAHVGRDFIWWNRHSKTLGSLSELNFSWDEEVVGQVIYTLRAYQGLYQGGGNFAAINKDGTPNLEVLKYWHANPEWVGRFSAVYGAIKEFAEENPEFSFLQDNLILKGESIAEKPEGLPFNIPVE